MNGFGLEIKDWRKEKRYGTAMDGFGFDYLNDSIRERSIGNIVDFDGSVSTVTSHE